MFTISEEINNMLLSDIVLVGTLVLGVFSLMVICMQTKIISEQMKIANQQNKISLFEKKYELFIHWSSLYYSSQKLHNFIERYKEEYYHTLESTVNKEEFFIKSMSILFPKSKGNKIFARYENKIYNCVINSKYFEVIPDIEKEYIVFFDFNMYCLDDCISQWWLMYGEVVSDINENIYFLKMILKLCNLKKRKDLEVVFKQFTDIQRCVDNENANLKMLVDNFEKLNRHIQDAELRDELFETIEIIK